jgi:hypothetical protein
MASQAKKLAIRAVAWLAGLVLALGLFTLVGCSMLADAIDRLLHWGRPSDAEVSRAQREAASRWWAAQLARAGGDAARAAELSGPAPVEELARLVKEAPAIVLDGEWWCTGGDVLRSRAARDGGGGPGAARARVRDSSEEVAPPAAAGGAERAGGRRGGRAAAALLPVAPPPSATGARLAKTPAPPARTIEMDT